MKLVPEQGQKMVPVTHPKSVTLRVELMKALVLMDLVFVVLVRSKICNFQ